MPDFEFDIIASDKLEHNTHADPRGFGACDLKCDLRGDPLDFSYAAHDNLSFRLVIAEYDAHAPTSSRSVTST